jgi:hypothetical protein
MVCQITYQLRRRGPGGKTGKTSVLPWFSKIERSGGSRAAAYYSLQGRVGGGLEKAQKHLYVI